MSGPLLPVETLRTAAVPAQDAVETFSSAPAGDNFGTSPTVSDNFHMERPFLLNERNWAEERREERMEGGRGG